MARVCLRCPAGAVLPMGVDNSPARAGAADTPADLRHCCAHDDQTRGNGAGMRSGGAHAARASVFAVQTGQSPRAEMDHRTHLEGVRLDLRRADDGAGGERVSVEPHQQFRQPLEPGQLLLLAQPAGNGPRPGRAPRPHWRGHGHGDITHVCCSPDAPFFNVVFVSNRWAASAAS